MPLVSQTRRSHRKGPRGVTFAFSPRFAVGGSDHIVYGKEAIPALLFTPDAPGPHPAAVIQHGYAAAKEDLVPLALFLAAYGFVSLLPDAWEHGERMPVTGPRWQTESSPDYFVDVVRHTVSGMREGLDLLGQRPDVRADAILIGGFSMGAMTSLIAGTLDDRVAGVVSIAGTTLPELMRAPLYSAHAPQTEARDWAHAHDAAEHLDRLAPKPLLLSHGRDDDLVPVTGALKLYEAAQPLYAAHPDRLALKLYDHRHTATPEQLNDALSWLAPFFLAGEEDMDEQTARAS